MQMKKNGIPEGLLPKFERIIQKYYVPNSNSSEGDKMFKEAMEKYLTKEQLFRLWEQHGGCQGTGRDKERKTFALAHADKPLPKRLEMFLKTIGNGYCKMSNKSVILDTKNNTLTVPFTCNHGFKHIREGTITTSLQFYFECCAGGRLYEFQKALGIKLKIKSVEVPVNISYETPVMFTFDIVDDYDAS
jgi:hypothetical protein